MPVDELVFQLSFSEKGLLSYKCRYLCRHSELIFMYGAHVNTNIVYTAVNISIILCFIIILLSVQGCVLTGITMACELFPASQRTVAGIAIQMFWVVAWVLLAVMAYFIRNWRYLQLTLSFSLAITLIEIWSELQFISCRL